MAILIPTEKCSIMPIKKRVEGKEESSRLSSGTSGAIYS